MSDDWWFEGENNPGAGDLASMTVLRDHLAATAQAARTARRSLVAIKDNANDTVWRGPAAAAFRDEINTRFLGQLDKLGASYQDAADGFSSYIVAVADIKDRADTLARTIYDAEQRYAAAAAALQNWLAANPADGCYVTGSVAASRDGSPYTVAFQAVTPPTADQTAARQQHATLQHAVDDAWAALQARYRQMQDLKDHDRVSADNAVIARLGKAHHAGIKNESRWHHFFHALSTVAKWAGIALLVVAVIAVICLVPELGLLGAMSAVSGIGGASATVAGLSVASLMAYGGALTSAISLTGGLGQRATGDGPSNKSIALDAFGAVPLLGKFGSAVRTATISGRLSGEETAAGEIIDVGHAGIHQFPGIKQGKSQFFDGENLGRLSDTNKVMGVLQKNGYVRYVLRAEHSVGVDRTSGLPTNVYTVIKKKDGSVVTLFPGTSVRG